MARIGETTQTLCVSVYVCVCVWTVDIQCL